MGLDRIDQPTLPLSGTYSYTANGTGVTAYVIDSGVQTNHPEFGTRAASSFDFLKGTGADCNGHGTAVAGIIGGKTYGVAKAVKIRSLRVLDCKGAGATSNVIAAVDWARTKAVRPAVVNLSLNGGKSAALDAAVKRLADSGVAVSVAAGNSQANACNSSPAGAGSVLTVAASDRADRHASFSNYGACVELYAPGVEIQTTGLNSGVTRASGTSMAAPHVAGVLALRMHRNAATASAARDWVLKNVTVGRVIGQPSGTPDKLVNKKTADRTEAAVPARTNRTTRSGKQCSRKVIRLHRNDQ